MSKRSRKSLPTLLLALCLLVVQGLVLAQPSVTKAATTGAAIYLNSTSNIYTAAPRITVTGTGFAANATVVVTFNAAYSVDGSPLSARTVPPNVARAGDNIDGVYAPPNVGSFGNYPNSIQVEVVTDANGNFGVNGINGAPTGNAAIINLPTFTADGNYMVTAYDVNGTAAQATYTVSHGPNISNGGGINNQPLTATPVYNTNGSVSIEGAVNVTAAAQTFHNGDLVQFYLEDFAASNTLGIPPAPTTGFHGVQTGASAMVPLEVLSCGSVPVVPGNGVGAGVTYCPADINGGVQAVVQLQASKLVNSVAINSLLYYDQVYSIVAINDGVLNGVNNESGTATATVTEQAGIHLDHGQTQIALSTNQQTLGGAVVVNGSGFGAFDPVQLYYVSLSPANLSTGVAFYSTPILLGTASTDASGHFLTTVAVNVNPTLTGPNPGTSPGYILAEDFSTNYAGIGGGLGLRLNEAATAAFALSASTSTNGLLSLQGQSALATTPAGVVSGNTVTVAISSTVTVTGTGYQPGEAVSFTLTGPSATETTLPYPGIIAGAGNNGEGTAPCDAFPLGAVTANAQGVAVVTFLVPENCNTVTVTSKGTVNAGAAVTVSGVGGSSGVTDKGALTINPTSAQVVPTNPAYAGSQAGVGFPINLTGAGFSANEPVTFQFTQVDPFLGTTTAAPVLSISTSSDVSGNVSISSVLPSSLTDGLYSLIARGLASGFTSATNIGVPFVYLQGNLNCPTSVLPGQVLPINGANFAPGTQVLVTVSHNTTAPLSLTNPLLAPVLSLTTMVTTGGTFAISPTVPLGTAPGTYTVTVSGLVENASTASQEYQQQLRQCTLTIGTTAPMVTVTPNSGPVGTTVTVVGTGFGNSEPMQLSLQYVDATGALTGTLVPGTAQVVSTTTTTGAFTSTYVIGSNVNALIAGQYNLTATGLQTGAIARTPFVVTGGPATLNPTTVFFAEGYTGSVAGGANADFSETLSILNANNYTTTYTVTYYIQSQFAGAPSTVKAFGGTLGPNSVVERSVNTDVGPNQQVAASVSSPAPIAADRVISRSISGKALDSSSSLGQLINLAAPAPTGGFNYYFADGGVTLTNEEYISMLNPTSSVANVTVNILPQTPASATSVPTIAPITLTIQPMSRATLPIRAAVLKAGAGISQFGVSINSNVALANERIEYYGDGIGSGKYGAVTKAAGTAGFRQLVFAASSGVFPSTGGNNNAGTGNDVSRIAIVNPGPSSAGSATVTVSAFDKTGAPINSQQIQVDGGTRQTVNLNDIVGTQSDVFSVIVTSDMNVYVEKVGFYGGDPANGGTFAAAGDAGAPAGLTSVQFPYLDLTSPTGTVISQTVYLYNPGATTITVRGTYLSQTGAAPVVKTYTVAPNAITAVSVNSDAATLPKGAVSGIFQIINNGGTTGVTGNGDSFVASVVANSSGFTNVTGDQGTFPIGAAQGS